MFSDVQITICSLQFSIFCQQNTLRCPSCGSLLENQHINQIQLSSLVLLIGFGSYIYYKHIIKKKKKINRNFNKNYAFLGNHKNYRYLNKTFQQRSEWFTNDDYSYEDDSYFSNNYHCSSIDSSDCEQNKNLTDDSMSLFMSEPLLTCEDTTVAKLDQLILQIQNIKESVVEIDASFNDINKSNSEYKLISINTSISGDFDINDSNTEPQTPSLEWDLTDLIGVNSQIDIKHANPPLFPLLAPDLFNSRNINRDNKIGSIDLISSPLDSMSNDSSLLSLNELAFSDKKSTIKRIIEELSKLGLLNDLKEVLETDHFKRDSAYFEY